MEKYMIEKYQYNTKYKNEHYNEYIKECEKLYGSPCTLDLQKECDVKMFHDLVAIDEARVPDAYDIKVFMVIPCRWHKKKRINKKMIKKHGHPNYVHKFETVKGWRLHSYTNGEFEFVKDGDKLLKMLKLQDL